MRRKTSAEAASNTGDVENRRSPSSRSRRRPLVRTASAWPTARRPANLLGGRLRFFFLFFFFFFFSFFGSRFFIFFALRARMRAKRSCPTARPRRPVQFDGDGGVGYVIERLAASWKMNDGDASSSTTPGRGHRPSQRHIDLGTPNLPSRARRSGC